MKTLAGGVFAFVCVAQITIYGSLATAAVFGAIWLGHHIGK